MGVIIGAIADAIGSVIGVAIEFFNLVTGNILNVLLQEVFEPILAFFGITDQDIYTVSLISVPVFETDQFKKTQIRLILDKVDKNKSSKDYILSYADVGHKQFNSYYYRGKYDFIDYLPTGQFNAVTIPTNELTKLLETEKQTEAYIIDIVGSIPYDDDWCKYQLQELYDYHILEDYLIIEDTIYKYVTSTYISNTNNFNVTIDYISEIKIITYENIETIITPINDVLDKKQTISTELKYYYRTDTGVKIKEESTELSNTIEEIESGIEFDSTILNFIDEEIITNISNPTILIVPNHNNVRQYLIKYTDLIKERFFYWYVDPTNPLYSHITSPVQKAVDFEMYPIATLRNNYYDINRYNDSGKPPAISKQRYEDTQELLSSLGINVDDLIDSYKQSPNIDKVAHAFFILGVNPINTEEITSIALFEMFEFIYNSMPPTQDSTSYSCSFKEYPYNSAIMWLARDTEIAKEIIGKIGTCSHIIRNNTIKEYKTTYIKVEEINFSTRKYTQYTESYVTDDYGYKKIKEISPIITKIVNCTIDDCSQYPLGEYSTTELTSSSSTKDLVLKKQISSTETKTMILSSAKAVTIINHNNGADGVSLDIDSKDLVIPLSPDMVNRLTLIEKTKLFNSVVFLQFYAVQHTHLEWYETSQFATFLSILAIIITIVVTIVTWGSGTLQSLSLSSALISLLEATALAVTLHFTLVLISDYIQNSTLKMILSIAAVVAAIYIGGGFSDFSFIDAAKLANTAVDVVNDNIQDLTNDVLKEMEAFNKLYEEKLEIFKTITEELDSGLNVQDIVNIAISDFDNIQTDNMRIRSVSSFFYTALNAYKNYDILYSLPSVSVSNFVNNKLQLIDSGEQI